LNDRLQRLRPGWTGFRAAQRDKINVFDKIIKTKVKVFHFAENIVEVNLVFIDLGLRSNSKVEPW